ncbi:sugar ABC transporter permease [Thermococcus argininiproducens]|uniref:Sugar ABC transporter permease n=1 Tax=Thermococcus argininiproducens TaxID=2866384 RepID=A0A9E7SDF1_9EURY|nr:sugar ABC transporter permease [Thermococcus argininiproducens]USH00761.1 sugar ABC transporter permease [Thermococcus argininiproducens]
MKRPKSLVSLFFLLPALILMVPFVIYPVFKTIYLSFFFGDEFVGLENYKNVLLSSDIVNLERFPTNSPPWGALVHNVVWIVIHLPVTVFLGLGIALLLRKKEVKGSSIVKSIVFLGMVIPMIVGGLIIRFLFEEGAGVVPAIFKALGIERLAITWTAYPQTALFAAILGSIWIWTGFSMLMYSAGLASIPRDYYEAALIDGASRFQIFKNVTWPLLKPITIVIVAMTLLWDLKIFDIVYVATGGGPGGASMVLALQMWDYFARALNYNYAAVVAVLLTTLTIIPALWLIRRRE